MLTAHQTPTPRLPEAAIIAERGLATAMIDVSDGLSADLGHLCDASGVGARLWVEAIPIDAPTRRVATVLREDPVSWALGGGEDYELLFTVPLQAADAIGDAVRRRTGTAVTVIGEILPAEEGRWLLFPDGRQLPLTPRGWTHF
ncbi:MAG TPA: hypothetical protein GX513_05895 [Firmicutes bacterium]|nr:hypothetical protein [Bacillota bacterium]